MAKGLDAYADAAQGAKKRLEYELEIAGAMPVVGVAQPRFIALGEYKGGPRAGFGPDEAHLPMRPGITLPEYDGCCATAGLTLVLTADEFADWAATRPREELAEPFTYVIGLDGALRLAPRRSEHVACAGGEPVLSAGEVRFGEDTGRWVVREVSNQSTGYCPDTDSWPAVAQALDRAGFERPGAFTHEVVFRRCRTCGQHNIVRQEHFVCVFCDADLPERWNLDP